MEDSIKSLWYTLWVLRGQSGRLRVYEEAASIVLWARPFPEALAELRGRIDETTQGQCSSDCSHSSLRNLPARWFQMPKKGPFCKEKLPRPQMGLPEQPWSLPGAMDSPPEATTLSGQSASGLSSVTPSAPSPGLPPHTMVDICMCNCVT